MNTKVAILSILAGSAVWAADSVPFAIKTGTWETTTTTQMSGGPQIPPEVLQRMPPEQRAKMEERMKAMQGKPNTTRHCVTEEDLKKAFNIGDQRPNCTRTVLSASSNKQDVKVECSSDRAKTTGIIHIESAGNELVKGTMDMTTTGAGNQEMKINSTFVSKWVGADCEKK
jgi:uncharacterized protein DUF3617